MARIKQIFPLDDTVKFSNKILQWVQDHETQLWLDSNQYPQKYSSFDNALALGVVTELKTNYKDAFKKLDAYQKGTEDYIFGYLSYDLKNDIEDLSSNNHDRLDFPDLYFFQPKKLFFIHKDRVEFHYDISCKDEIEKDLALIKNTDLTKKKKTKKSTIEQRISKHEYYKKIDKILLHIKRGDTYELNFCMEYYAENASIEPLEIYKRLNAISTPPFATYFRNKDHYLLSASPERFVRKEGQKIISQPIKGTIKRGSNIEEDNLLIQQLKNDPKERSENIMIVDLVRNDLSKTATKNSVTVEELCEVYSFKQVHQLISTISSEAKKDISPVQIIKSLFPMGSMTGAPKISTMKIIEDIEESKRGLYSGAVGYFTPNNDFDFNVVIRSILYNALKKYVSFSVGGAITARSKTDHEYKECKLKAVAMINVLTK